MPKYRFNPFTGTFDDSGAVTGVRAAISNPKHAQGIADTLNNRIRLFRYDTTLPSTVYVATTGSDSTGLGTSGSPWATIDRALQFIGLNNPANVTISLGAGTFTMPTVLNQLVNITFSGTVSTTESALPVASIQRQSQARRLVFTITRGSTLADDAWRGKLISFSNAGTLSNQRGWVVANQGNKLFVEVGQSLASAQLTTSSTISLLSLDTNLRYLTGNNTLTSSSLVQTTACQITGDAAGRIPFFVATDKWQFNDCYFAVNRPQIGQAGGAWFFRCYINSLGDTTEGLLSIVRGGNCRIGQGSVIDTQNAATNEKFIRVAQDAKLSFDGPLTVRGLEAKGFFVEGANTFVEGGVDVLDTILFFDFDNTSTTCAGAFQVNQAGEGSGGTVTLPTLNGTISGNYSVLATKDAYVRYNASSSLATALGTNTVSADSGTSLSSQNIDGTDIIGATPSYAAEHDGLITITSANSPYTLDLSLTGILLVDTSSGAVTINLSASSAYTKGSHCLIKDAGNAGTNAITVNANGTDTIDGAGSKTTNVNYASYRLFTNGAGSWFTA